jgi:hypothetical protein
MIGKVFNVLATLYEYNMVVGDIIEIPKFIHLIFNSLNNNFFGAEKYHILKYLCYHIY